MDSVISNLTSILPQLSPSTAGVDTTPEEAIVKASDRLIHSNDVATRRSAVQELKNYSRQYRDLIVDNSLRGLVNDLHKDREHPEIVRYILETLLILFIRGEGVVDLTRDWIVGQGAQNLRQMRGGKYPSPLLIGSGIDHISYWIADELTTSTTSFDLLVDLLLTSVYPATVYILQLLQALAVTRLERTQECILASPAAVDTLVAQLRSTLNDQIRNETVLLLLKITQNNETFSKSLVFHADFDVFFLIIAEEGGIRGSVIVSDVLQLLSNVLIYNAINQQLFLSNTMIINRLASLLVEPLLDSAFVWTDQRLTNTQNSLLIVRMFVLDEATKTTHQNQQKLSASGILQAVLQVAFHPATPNKIRAFALATIAELVQYNPDLQRQLQTFDIPFTDLANSGLKSGEVLSVLDCCLQWMLHANSIHVFSIRMACLRLLKAFVRENPKFCQGYTQWCLTAYEGSGGLEEGKEEPGEDTEEPSFTANTPNILLILTEFSTTAHLNPYQYWFAAVLLLHLFQESPECREVVQSTVIGADDEDSEESSFIQTISGLLVPFLKLQEPRVSLGYLQLLSLWLYENSGAVNDFLEEGSTVHALIAYLSDLSNDSDSQVKGMITILLGTVYEFSTSTSPMTRASLHNLFTKTIGIDNYGFKVRQFRQLLQEFDPESTSAISDKTGLPDVFYDEIFVSAFNANFPRLVKAMTRDPSHEPVEKLTFEVVDELLLKNRLLASALQKLAETSSTTVTALRGELDEVSANFADVTDMLEQSREEMSKLEDTHSEVVDKYGALDSEVKQLSSLKQSLDAKVTKYEAELQSLRQMGHKGDRELSEYKLKLESVEAERDKHADGVNKMSKELMKLLKVRDEKDKELKKLNFDLKKLVKEIETCQLKMESQKKTYEKQVQELDGSVESLKLRIAETTAAHQQLQTVVAEMETEKNNTEAVNRQVIEKLRTAAQRLDTMEAEKVALGSKLEELAKTHTVEISHLKDQVSKLSATNSTLKHELAGAETQCSELASSKAEVDKDHARLSAELVEARTSGDTQATKLKEFLDSAVAANKLLEEEKTGLEGQIASLSTEVAKLTEDMEVSSKAVKYELEELKKENERLKAELDASSELVAAKGEELNQNEQRLSQLQESYASLEETHTTAISTMQLESEALIKSLNLKMLELEAASSAMADQLTEFQTLNATLGTSIDDLTSKHDSLATKHAALESDHSELQQLRDQQTSKFEGIVKAHKEEISLLHDSHAEKVKGMQSSIDDTKKASDKAVLAKAAELASSQEQVSALETVLEKTKTGLDTAEADRSALAKSLEDLKASTQLSEEQLNANIGELVSKQAALQQTKDELEAKLLVAGKTLDDVTEKHSSCVAKIALLEAEISEGVKSKEVLVASKAGADESVAVLTSQVEGLKSANTELSTEKNALLADLKGSEKSLASLKSKHESTSGLLNERVKKLELEIELLHEQLEKKSKAIEKERMMLTENSTSVIQEYSLKISELEESLKSVKKSSGKSDTISEELKAEIELLNKEVHILKLDAEAMELKRTDHETQMKLLQTEKTSQEETVASMLEEIKSLKAQVDTEKKTSHELQTELSELRKSGSDENATFAEEIKKVKELNNGLSEKVKALEPLEVQLKDEVAKSAGLALEVTALAKSVDELTAVKEATEAAAAKVLSTHSEELKASTASIEKLTKENTDLGALVATKETAIEALQRRLDQLESDLAKLKEDTDDLMLLMSDMDEKYKAKIKLLGGEVSESEDEDED
ncbi:hypothetical protein BABINDRAFT_37763 [Babjeviella inositovora NRRL Y-12698]|uniref:Vesicle tethering protein Uso1/P115-like head domain-containing protein n=1 Tax=Babjeviella inositovora NRRL Y-12698 TaxID=984486 RepID=A0A1E3QMY1_9ASCO|nr:uncharacterized protein BABINDRAFT_37763 [Babjeviella inositovora NRRL Y-12698]ODQ79033.1 hypothetical protein BABINDRAFT_37763 [Babjeviella inositovora NRRL Y-12698]